MLIADRTYLPVVCASGGQVAPVAEPQFGSFQQSFIRNSARETRPAEMRDSFIIERSCE